MTPNVEPIPLAILAVTVLLFLSACETTPREHVLDSADAVIADAIQSQPRAQVPRQVADALLPSLALNELQTLDVQDDQRFDIAVDGAPATQFFMSLVEGTRYNMVVHPEVQGVLSLNLRDVTILEVMEAVRDVYGFEFVRTPYGFQVLPGRLPARIYQINFLNVLRSGRSSSFVSSGALTGSRATGGNGEDDSLSSTVEQGRDSSILGTQINTEQPETAFWQELLFSIEAILGTGDGRSVVVNPQSGVVVVRALPSELREVETFLRATQLIVQRQVILEAKIVEVELSERFQTGINWAALLEVGSSQAVVGQTGGGTVLGNGNASDIAGSAGNLDPSSFNPIPGALASAFGGVFSVAYNSDNFNAFVELLKLQGNVQVLSSPRIATLNNQKAVIKVGTDEFFVTDISTTTTTGFTSVSTPNVELTPFFSGIALDVTPQISEAGDVTLHIHPSVSQVIDQEKTITVGGLTQVIPLALSTVRESDSIVRAASGQVVVVGGLMLDRLDDDHAKPPGLGDIPGVGGLFRQRLNRTVKSELVILLRPIVVEDSQQWTDALMQSSTSLTRLRSELRTREKPPKGLVNQ